MKSKSVLYVALVFLGLGLSERLCAEDKRMIGDGEQRGKQLEFTGRNIEAVNSRAPSLGSVSSLQNKRTDRRKGLYSTIILFNDEMTETLRDVRYSQ